MSSLEEVRKTADEIVMSREEEIIEEEVIEEEIQVEQVEWMGPSGDQAAYYPGEELLEHQIVEYEENEPYQSFLPIRDGAPFFSLNLPDLLSKNHEFINANGSAVGITSCFNKKCQRQVACGGYLYTVKNYVYDSQWNHWLCVNENCYGEIRTSPDFREVRISADHDDQCCHPDELQISLRIAVYDTRLLAEFTDTPLESLYMAAVDRIKTDCSEAILLFPSFDVLKGTLEDHRINKIYRKRFEMQNLKDKQKKLNMTPDEVVFTENASGLIKFRRTKLFPVSHCNGCNDQFISNSLPSQDQLVAHYMYNHNRRITIERFEFKDLNLFDQYMRELNIRSRFKLKRMGIADENMYYLCALDDRLAKSGVGRASRLQQQICHCTAFIRVFDWRLVSKRTSSRVMIDYCLEHQLHPEDPPKSPTGSSLRREFIDYYTPEVFLRDMEDRRQRSQKAIDQEAERGPTRKRLEAKNFVAPGRLRPSFGGRALAPPVAARVVAPGGNNYVDVFDDSPRLRSSRRQPIRYAKPEEEESHVTPSAPPPPSTSSEAPPPRIFITQKPYTRLTERQNFKDIYTFNAICKMEDCCLSLLNRMQTCQNPRIAMAYREKIASILRNSTTDPALVDGATIEEMQKSWVLQKAIRGRPKKRMREEDGEEGVDGDEDVEMEMGMTEEDDEVTERITVGEEVEEKREEPEGKGGEIEIPPPLPKSTPSVTSTSSGSSDITKRSGRSRKVPARLQ